MLQFLHPITNWLLIAVVLTGQIPALIHKVECVHACAAGEDSCDVETRACTGCCGKSLCNTTPEGATPSVDHDSASSEHECDDCTICQSLFSTNGLVGISDQGSAPELLQVELLAAEQVAPELTRFGISQSRAPPGYLA